MLTVHIPHVPQHLLADHVTVRMPRMVMQQNYKYMKRGWIVRYSEDVIRKIEKETDSTAGVVGHEMVQRFRCGSL